MSETAPLTVVIPTYRREGVLLETLQGLMALTVPPAEIIVVDQTENHEATTEQWLAQQAERRSLRWIRLKEPSIPAAMNVGLLEAKHEVVLFLDDDSRPAPSLAEAHVRAHGRSDPVLVVGRVLQPWHTASPCSAAGFAAAEPGPRDEFIGCNFSIRRDCALGLGGFDERFVRVAYRFEAEFAERLRASGGLIWFEPAAIVHHMKAPTGGTRTFGDHLRTASPAHAVGEYYYLLRARPRDWFRRLVSRPWRSVITRHHLRRPWWIPVSLVAEFLGVAWGVVLWMRGPKLVGGGR